MDKTLSEITLDHSRKLSELEADCRRQRQDVDAQRDAALRAVPGGDALFAQMDASRARADETLARAMAEADDAHRAAERSTAGRLSDGLATINNRYRVADRAADEARDQATAAANAAYRKKLAEISKLPLAQQFNARDEAQQVLRDALRKADADWRAARDADRDVQQRDLHAALDQERRESEGAASTLTLAQQAAQQIHDHDVQTARNKLDTALTALAGASAIQKQFADRTTELARECRAREEQLFEEFRKALADLRRRGG